MMMQPTQVTYAVTVTKTTKYLQYPDSNSPPQLKTEKIEIQFVAESVLLGVDTIDEFIVGNRSPPEVITVLKGHTLMVDRSYLPVTNR